ncbi:hypothetical protein KM043_000328 [Ampulex compressa]|nr:hypothetical protein KM043_000328 [Ampulex compressa]
MRANDFKSQNVVAKVTTNSSEIASCTRLDVGGKSILDRSEFRRAGALIIIAKLQQPSPLAVISRFSGYEPYTRSSPDEIVRKKREAALKVSPSKPDGPFRARVPNSNFAHEPW